MRFPILAAVVLMGATPAAADSRISDHMIDCSALYSLAAAWGNKADRAARLHAVAGSYALAAEAHAVADGISEPRRHVATRFDRSWASLMQRGPLYISSVQFTAQMRACHVLGHEAGVSARLWLLSD